MLDIMLMFSIDVNANEEWTHKEKQKKNETVSV